MLTRVRGTISLATNPGSLVRFAFHDVVDWQPWMDSRHQPPASKASALRLSYRVIKKEKCPRRERPARKRILQTRSASCVAAGAAIALALSEV